MQVKTILRQVPDPRGKQGQDYMLWSILSLIVVSLLCGRRGMKAAFLLGRSLSRRQKAELGFIRGTTPCHATLTETLRVIDAQALADVLGGHCHVNRKFADQMTMAVTVHAATVAWRHVSIA